jgi:hypothetical protein
MYHYLMIFGKDIIYNLIIYKQIICMNKLQLLLVDFQVWVILIHKIILKQLVIIFLYIQIK